MPMNRLPGVAALMCGLWLGAAHAVPLNDTRPERLKAFVQPDRVTVVLFTSPDPRCGYCVGQLDVFNAAAGKYRGEPPVFAFVQWKPWREFPAMDLPRPVYGIPHVKIYRKGEVLAELDGRLTDPAKLTTLVDDALAGKLQPMPPVAAPAEEPAAPPPAPKAKSAPPAAAWSEPERAAVSIYLRKELLTTVSRSCAKKHPTQAESAQRAEAAWTARHGQAADRGLMLVMGAPSSAALRTLTDPLGKAQARELDEQLTMKPGLAAEDCLRAYGFMGRDDGGSAAR